MLGENILKLRKKSGLSQEQLRFVTISVQSPKEYDLKV